MRIAAAKETAFFNTNITYFSYSGPFKHRQESVGDSLPFLILTAIASNAGR